MSKRIAALLFLGVLALAAGCRDSGKESEFFAISGKLFVFNYRVATATYLVVLKPLQPMDGNQTAVASFENPAGGDPIVVRQKVWPQLDKVTLESPPLQCVKKDRPYRVSIRIEDGGALKQLIETTMKSTEDQSILPDEPLVAGPTYTPNPDLVGHPGGKLDDPDKFVCPA
ncbi:MAG: hypothetical protein INR68_19345 [Methylobacterium mesophilicum]|nr:hypothetical protein [Methylobacterium mesophilicum]